MTKATSKQEESSGHSTEEDVGGDEEEDEDEEEDQAAEAETSILPSSVLDQASTIAEHFVSSTRRSSSTTDDVRSVGCSSPCVPSRTGSLLSLGGGEAHEWSHRINSNHCSEGTGVPMSHDAYTGVDVTMLSDNVFDNSFRRRDSTLSKRDQQLIDKIKSYYDNAEYVDAGFSIKRRESLTYIPTGFVRSSVTKLNSIPSEGTEKKGTSTTASDVSQSLYSESRERLTSNETCNALEFGKGKASERSEHESEVSFDSVRDKTKCQLQRDVAITEEEFLPSSEMIKVWQQMEKEISRSQDDARGLPRRRDAHRIRVASPNMSRKTLLSRTTSETDSTEPLMILEESDLSTITEESTSPSPVKGRGMVLGRSASLSDYPRPREMDGRLRRAPVPRVIQLRAEAEMEVPKNEPEGDDGDASQSKVFHLARKYSQRIKCTNPLVRQRSQDSEGMLGKRSLSCVLEERPERGRGKA